MMITMMMMMTMMIIMMTMMMMMKTNITMGEFMIDLGVLDAMMIMTTIAETMMIII